MFDFQFKPSDKFRELSRNVVLFSAITLFFSIYHIPLASVPFVALPLDAESAKRVFEHLDVAGPSLLATLFLTVQAYLLLATEYVDYLFEREQGLLNGFIETAPKESVILDLKHQEAWNDIQAFLHELHGCRKVLGYLRLIFEIIFPALLAAVATWLAAKNLWAFINALVFSANLKQ